MKKAEIQSSIEEHSKVCRHYGVFAGPNKDYLPDGILYYLNEDDKTSFLEITPHDPVKALPVLKKSLAIKFPDNIFED